MKHKAHNNRNLEFTDYNIFDDIGGCLISISVNAENNPKGKQLFVAIPTDGPKGPKGELPRITFLLSDWLTSGIAWPGSPIKQFDPADPTNFLP